MCGLVQLWISPFISCLFVVLRLTLWSGSHYQLLSQLRTASRLYGRRATRPAPPYRRVHFSRCLQRPNSKDNDVLCLLVVRLIIGYKLSMTTSIGDVKQIRYNNVNHCCRSTMKLIKNALQINAIKFPYRETITCLALKYAPVIKQLKLTRP